MKRLAVLALALSLAGAVPADTALDARERLMAAAGLLDASKTAGDRVAALTDAVLAYETGLSALRSELRRLALRERELTAELADEDGDITTLLAMMQNATAQAETQSLLHPGSAVDTIRAGTLARVLVPALYDSAAQLEGQLGELSELRILIEAAERSMSEGLQGVQEARTALGQALTDREDLPPRLATNEAAMEALVNSADTLSGLADSLLADGGLDAPPQRWRLPVAEAILIDTRDGDRRPGWALATEPRALLTSPADVTVRYSGEFPENGTVVILEGDSRQLAVLAGLSASFVSRGQVLAAGDPVGFAGGGQLAAQDKLNARGADATLFIDETLYIEIRQGGTPVDPATVLTLEQEQG
jgi:septal ring factor EnvC (AmiA/AmiB activator)